MFACVCVFGWVDRWIGVFVLCVYGGGGYVRVFVRLHVYINLHRLEFVLLPGQPDTVYIN